MTKTFRSYQVWPHFPSISISGCSCALDCPHCKRIYIDHMMPASSPKKFKELAQWIVEKEKRRGILISGGNDTSGRLLNLKEMLPAISDAIDEHGLIVKLHTGLLDKEMAELVVSSGVHIPSMEMMGNQQVIKKLFGLDIPIQAYIDTFKFLEDAGAKNISPHIAVGLPYQGQEGALNALKLISENITPSKIMTIVFRPTKGTPLESSPTASAQDLEEFIIRSKELMPDVPVLLGAMRPRESDRNDPDHAVRYALEEAALAAKVDGMEIPSKELLGSARALGYRIKQIDAYGVLPIELEEEIGCRWI